MEELKKLTFLDSAISNIWASSAKGERTLLVTNITDAPRSQPQISLVKTVHGKQKGAVPRLNILQAANAAWPFVTDVDDVIQQKTQQPGTLTGYTQTSPETNDITVLGIPQ